MGEARPREPARAERAGGRARAGAGTAHAGHAAVPGEGPLLGRRHPRHAHHAQALLQGKTEGRGGNDPRGGERIGDHRRFPGADPDLRARGRGRDRRAGLSRRRSRGGRARSRDRQDERPCAGEHRAGRAARPRPAGSARPSAGRARLPGGPPRRGLGSLRGGPAGDHGDLPSRAQPARVLPPVHRRDRAGRFGRGPGGRGGEVHRPALGGPSRGRDGVRDRARVRVRRARAPARRKTGGLAVARDRRRDSRRAAGRPGLGRRSRLARAGRRDQDGRPDRLAGRQGGGAPAAGHDGRGFAADRGPFPARAPARGRDAGRRRSARARRRPRRGDRRRLRRPRNGAAPAGPRRAGNRSPSSPPPVRSSRSSRRSNCSSA